jgi:hypothetical protein
VYLDAMFVWFISHQPAFLSEQISHQQPANSTFLLEQISTSHHHQPNEQGGHRYEPFGGGVN